MKAEREDIKPPFTPVVVTLETQEEVDKFFAMTNNARISTALGLDDWWEEVEDYASKKCRVWLDKLRRILRDENDDDDD